MSEEKTMKNTDVKIPALRFPDFSGEWEEKRLGEIGVFSGGGTPSTANNDFWNGTIPWVSSSDILEDNILDVNISRYITKEALASSATKVVPQNSILIVSRVGVGKLAINRIPLCTSQDFLNLTPSSANFLFLAYLLSNNKSKLKSLEQGTSIKGFVKEDFIKLKNNFPSLPEQQKIADFLSAVDKRLQLLKDKKTKLENYKRGAMQRIFSQELRFTRADGSAYEDWEEKKLGEVLIEVSEKTTSNNQFNAISSTAKGLFLQSDYFTREIASKNNIGYKILSLNQLVFSPQNLWLGNINVNLNFEKGIVSPSYKIYSFEKNILDVLFASYIMKTKELLYEYILCSEMGASVVRRNLNIDLFLKIKINLPSLEEQTQIANFLSAIDVKIEKLSEQIEATENYKKGLLQQMFV